MLKNENEAYDEMLYTHLLALAQRLREIPVDRWEWAPEVCAPSPRILAEHAWQWLVCDRQHILEPDITKHARVPDPPPSQQTMCDVLAEETETWHEMVLRMKPDKLNEPRTQFGQGRLNVRWFLYHMCQNVVYKHGQLSTIYFALGLDGSEPYTAPFPNDFYLTDVSQ